MTLEPACRKLRATCSTTAEHLAHALHVALPPERLHMVFNALDLEFARWQTATGAPGQPQPGLILKQANTHWGQRDRPFQPVFLDLLARHIGTGLRLADFRHHAQAARRTIDAWVGQQTEHKSVERRSTLTLDGKVRAYRSTRLHDSETTCELHPDG